MQVEKYGKRRPKGGVFFVAAYVPAASLLGFKLDVPFRRKRRNGMFVDELLFSLHFKQHGEVIKSFNVSAQLEAVQ